MYERRKRKSNHKIERDLKIEVDKQLNKNYEITKFIEDKLIYRKIYSIEDKRINVVQTRDLIKFNYNEINYRNVTLFLSHE